LTNNITNIKYDFNLPIIPQTGNGLSFQILCGGEGFTKESKMPYAPKGKYVFDTLHLWVL